jgi:hypothetical protein
MNGLRKLVSAIHPRTLARNTETLESVSESTQDVRSEMDEIRRNLREIQETVSKLAVQAAAAHLKTEQLLTLHHDDIGNRGRMDRLEQVLDAERTSAHVREAIDRSELFDDPFPHLVVTDLLPPRVYKTMINAIPPRIFFEDRRINKQQLAVPLEFAPAYSVAVWEFLTQIVKDTMGPALANRFQQPLDRYVRTLCPSLGSLTDAGITMKFSEGRILLRRPGYVIAPHRDPQWGFLTTIVYLARPEDREDYGTQLYRLEVESESPTNGPHYLDPAVCRLVKTVPFRANTALTFLNSTGAHGASIPADAPADTERYIYQIRIGPEKDASRAFLDQMDEATRRKWERAGRGY